MRRILVELEPFDFPFPIHEASRKEYPINDSTLELDAPLNATGPYLLADVVMSSDSDWPTMEPTVAALAEPGTVCEAGAVSVYRMFEDMFAHGRSASTRGSRVIIAGVGGAAHLPGMLAALTKLVVVGVPVPLKYLDGMDSFHPIVQIPAGVLAAIVSVAGARNAGLLAARILPAGEGFEAEALRAKMRGFQKGLHDPAWDKGAALAQKVRSSSQG